MENRNCRYCVSLLFFCLLCQSAGAQDEPAKPTATLHGKPVRFVDVPRGKALLGSSDEFVKNLSDFDRAIRLRSQKPVDQQTFLKHAAEQVQKWEAEDIKKLTAIVQKLDAKIRERGLRLPLPDEILVVKTSGNEEAGPMAPYTRGTAIVLTAQMVKSGDHRTLSSVFLHELFHVISRNRPEIRKPLYHLIGFAHCGPIEYPKSLMERKITNPDAFHFDFYVAVAVNNVPTLLTPLTLAKSTPYKQGGLFANLSIEFLELEVSDTGAKPRLVEGKPRLHQMQAIAPGYFKKIGRNTNYIIHPEEIMADNFSMAVMGQPNPANPEILQGVIRYFSTLEKADR